MSWFSKCRECNQDISYSEKCKESYLCLNHRKNTVTIDHMKNCSSCKVLLSNYPKCKICFEHNSEIDLNYPSSCKQHKYCIKCINGKTRTIKNPDYPKQTFQLEDGIKCNSCLKFFRSLFKPPRPPNCFFCGMFATSSELCAKHQYCKECRDYLSQTNIHQIERIKNCPECFQEFSPEYIEQQAIKKANEESLRINKGNGINAPTHMNLDKPSKNYDEEIKKTEGWSNNYQDHKDYLNHTNEGDYYNQNQSGRKDLGNYEQKNVYNQFPNENKLNNFGNDSKAGDYNFDGYSRAPPNPNERGGYIDQKNYSHDPSNQIKFYGYNGEKHDFRDTSNPYKYNNEFNRFEGPENSKFFNQNGTNWDRSNHENEDMYNLKQMPSDSEKDAEKTSISNESDIYKNYIDPSVMLEELENKRIADSIVSTSQKYNINKNNIGSSVMHEEEQIDRIENYVASVSKNENPTQILNTHYEKNLPRTDIHENPLGPHHFNNLPDLLTICPYCKTNEGVILSVCGHTFCKFCFFIRVQYQPIFTFINSISSNSPIAEIFTYKCTCSLPFISYLPTIPQLDYIQYIYKDYTEAKMGETYNNFSIIAPSDYLLRYYSFYLDGLPCKFESCKNCNSRQYAAEIEPYCLWCMESFHT